MRRMLSALALGVAVAAVAQAHALYVVPAADGAVTVVFSDDLNPDDRVKDATWKKLDKLELLARGADGKDTPVKWQKAEHKLTATAPAGTRVVFAAADFGVSTRGAKPALVKFYPKAVVGAAADGAAAGTPLEIFPVTEAGKVRFRVLLAGKPLAAAKASVLTPEKPGEAAEATTDEHGLTPGFPVGGRFGVTVRHVEPAAGERGGEKYEQVSHVATLVADVK